MPLFEMGKAEWGGRGTVRLVTLNTILGRCRSESLDTQKPSRRGLWTPDWAPASILLWSLLLLALLRA